MPKTIADYVVLMQALKESAIGHADQVSDEDTQRAWNNIEHAADELIDALRDDEINQATNVVP